jgi:hypothetical protein
MTKIFAKLVNCLLFLMFYTKKTGSNEKRQLDKKGVSVSTLAEFERDIASSQNLVSYYASA